RLRGRGRQGSASERAAIEPVAAASTRSSGASRLLGRPLRAPPERRRVATEEKRHDVPGPPHGGRRLRRHGPTPGRRRPRESAASGALGRTRDSSRPRAGRSSVHASRLSVRGLVPRRRDADDRRTGQVSRYRRDGRHAGAADPPPRRRGARVRPRVQGLRAAGSVRGRDRGRGDRSPCRVRRRPPRGMARDDREHRAPRRSRLAPHAELVDAPRVAAPPRPGPRRRRPARARPLLSIPRRPPAVLRRVRGARDRVRRAIARCAPRARSSRHGSREEIAMATFSPRLSALDAAFLYFERPNQRMQVGCVVELEAPIAYQELVAAVTERLAAIARYRQRPVRATFDLDRPAWEDDPGFDVERHVHHVALPAPGGPQELHALVDALFEAPLDPDHPLWEVHLIDGLAGGRAAMLWKVHHCMVDGVSGAQILTLVTDGAGRDASAAPPVAGCGRAVARTDETAIGLLASVARALRPSAALQLARDVGTALGTIRRMVTEPNTVLPFNGPLSGRRHVVWTSLALDDVMAVRAHAGCKVNDVVLAIIADALHRYVEARGVRSAEARVRAIVPVSVRGDGERLAMGNLVTALLPTLPIGPATPLDRLRRVAGEMAAMKENGELRAAGLVLALAGALPAPLEAVLGRFAPDTPIANTVCTNVPGPRDERSVLGRRILAIHPIVPLFQGMGLEFAVMSYAGRLSIAAVA